MNIFRISHLIGRRSPLMWGVIAAVVMTMLYTPVHAAQHSTLEVAETCSVCLTAGQDDVALIEAHTSDFGQRSTHEVARPHETLCVPQAATSYHSRAPPVITL